MGNIKRKTQAVSNDHQSSQREALQRIIDARRGNVNSSRFEDRLEVASNNMVLVDRILKLEDDMSEWLDGDSLTIKKLDDETLVERVNATNDLITVASKLVKASTTDSIFRDVYLSRDNNYDKIKQLKEFGTRVTYYHATLKSEMRNREMAFQKQEALKKEEKRLERKLKQKELINKFIPLFVIMGIATFIFVAMSIGFNTGGPVTY